MSFLKDKPVSDRIPAPAKRWRNKYRAKIKCLNREHGVLQPGDFAFGVRTYPSKDLAETRSGICGISGRNLVREGIYEYLGAFPE